MLPTPARIRSLLITRPAGLAEGLAVRLQTIGVASIVLPLIEIAPPPNPDTLAATLPRLPACQWAIFVSPSAARTGLAAVREHFPAFPESVRLAAVGEGSAKPLRDAVGRPVLISLEGADSEALLACPELQALAGQRVMLFRGVGGRTQISDTLTARGATVLHAVCYERRRLSPDVDALLVRWRKGCGKGCVDAVSVTSTEILDQLVRVLGEAGRGLLQAIPLFVPHPRIAAAARAYGIGDVRLIAPGDEGLIAALQAAGSEPAPSPRPHGASITALLPHQNHETDGGPGM